MTDIDDLDELERELGPRLRPALQRAASTITGDAPAALRASADGEMQEGVMMVDLASSPRTISTPQRRRPRVAAGLIAAAAAVVVVAVVVVLSSLDRHNTAAERSQRVAETFMTSWVQGDSAGLEEVLAPDAAFDAWTPETLAELGDWLEALGWHYTNEGCEAVADDKVVCDYTADNDLTRAFGRDPVAGSFVVTVDGDIVSSVVDDLNVGSYRDIALAFGTWISAQHASEISQMYTVGVGYPRIDPVSIGLWKTYTRTFVDTGDAYVARARLICGAAHTRYDALVANTQNEKAKSAAAAQVLGEALAELQRVPPPALVKTSFDVGTSLIAQLVDAYGRSTSGGAEVMATVLANLPHTEVGLDRCAIDPSR